MLASLINTSSNIINLFTRSSPVKRKSNDSADCPSLSKKPKSSDTSLTMADNINNDKISNDNFPRKPLNNNTVNNFSDIAELARIKQRRLQSIFESSCSDTADVKRYREMVNGFSSLEQSSLSFTYHKQETQSFTPRYAEYKSLLQSVCKSNITPAISKSASPKRKTSSRLSCRADSLQDSQTPTSPNITQDNSADKDLICVKVVHNPNRFTSDIYKRYHNALSTQRAIKPLSKRYKEDISTLNESVIREGHRNAALAKSRTKTSEKLCDLLEVKLKIHEPLFPVITEYFPEPKKEYPDLSDAMENEIKRALRPSNDVLASGFRINIKGTDMVTLTNGTWLNDEIINFYLSLVAERNSQQNLPRVHVYNTFFLPRLQDQGYQSVSRWTRRVDIFSFDILLVPVHVNGVHWALATVDFRNKIISYFDSLGSSNNRCLIALNQYLQSESLDKKKKSYPVEDWRHCCPNDIPLQKNGSDCGVFTCMFAEHYTRDALLDFSQKHMPYFRRKMVYEILHKQILE